MGNWTLTLDPDGDLELYEISHWGFLQPLPERIIKKPVQKKIGNRKMENDLAAYAEEEILLDFIWIYLLVTLITT